LVFERPIRGYYGKKKRILQVVNQNNFFTRTKPGNRAVKMGCPTHLGPALAGFGLYRAGAKSPVEKRA